MAMRFDPAWIRPLLAGAFVVIAVPWMMREARRPSRGLGRLFLWSMNRSHSPLTDWGLAQVAIANDAAILDVGCGGGRTIQKLAARAAGGRVCGADISAGSVDASRATNAARVRAGRVEVKQASVSQLPWPDATFDLVTAVETHYYWPDPPRDLAEVRRVLKPGGTAVVIAEAYKGGSTYAAQAPFMRLVGATLMSADEHRAWFERAGLTGVQVHERRGHGWICVTGKRPA